MSNFQFKLNSKKTCNHSIFTSIFPLYFLYILLRKSLNYGKMLKKSLATTPKHVCTTHLLLLLFHNTSKAMNTVLSHLFGCGSKTICCNNVPQLGDFCSIVCKFPLSLLSSSGLLLQNVCRHGTVWGSTRLSIFTSIT